MKLTVIHYADWLSKSLVKGKIAVVIDVFRATSVITTALANGAKEVVVTREIDEALAEFNRRGESNCVLGGERNMEKITGFHYGNSPLSYTRENVCGKTVILTTTNGTKAIRYCEPAKEIYVCSMFNCRHLAEKFICNDCDIVVVCSGSKNNFSLEDAFCAGMFVSHIDSISNVNVDDFGLAMKFIYEQNKNNVRKLLIGSKAYSGLNKKGYCRDINLCLQSNLYDITPRCINKNIII